MQIGSSLQPQLRHPLPAPPETPPPAAVPATADAAARGRSVPSEPITAAAGPFQFAADSSAEDPLREQFRAFVGNTLFGQMLSAMRDSLDKPAYFHGGRGEEIFQQQLDQTLVEEITEASADQLADPMFELFRQRTR